MKLFSLLITACLLVALVAGRRPARPVDPSPSTSAVDPRYPKTAKSGRDHTSNPYGCGIGEWKCDNGECIAACKYNDGRQVDCSDGSDEQSSTPPAPSCGVPPIAPDLGASGRGLSGRRRTSNDKESRVDNGVEAKPHSWPWQVHIGNCGGTIVSERLVVTAAHCRYYNMSSAYVRAGLHDITQAANQERWGTLIWHSGWKTDRGQHDIGLIKIDPPFEFNDHVQPACLPTALAPKGQMCYVTGWGVDIKQNEANVYPNKLTQAKQVMLDAASECSNFINPQTQICVLGPEATNGEDGAQNESSCYGDSGGPLVCQNAAGNWELQGIVHSGTQSSCGSGPNGPDVATYTKVLNYLSYIQPHM